MPERAGASEPPPGRGLRVPRLLLSAAHKSSGKTTITAGLCAALRAAGRRVQPFKKGPDYIDPIWLATASGRRCYNLDFNTSEPEAIRELFADRAEAVEIALIEGNKGLYDGMARDGSNSNAALARLLGAPVVLVLDTRGVTRGVAPLLLGYQAFEPEVRIAGVILNQVGGPRHEGKLREAVADHTDIPVLGAVRRDPGIEIRERHLGLVPGNELSSAAEMVGRLAGRVAEQVDIPALLAAAGEAPVLAAPRAARSDLAAGPEVRIGLARDEAFGFYYADDLEALEAAGGRLVPIDTLRDRRLPDIDGLIIGGGFPEMRLEGLEANTELREGLRRVIQGGLPTYAECGGLMYLARTIHWAGRTGRMVGVIPADVVMHERPQGRGYARVRLTGKGLWGAEAAGEVVPAHEFHYSGLEGLEGSGVGYAYRVERGTGLDGRCDGIVYRNLLASYIHLRNTGRHRWTDRFLDQVRAVKAGVR